jgi:hypothetical protein
MVERIPATRNAQNGNRANVPAVLYFFKIVFGVVEGKDAACAKTKPLYTSSRAANVPDAPKTPNMTSFAFSIHEHIARKLGKCKGNFYTRIRVVILQSSPLPLFAAKW